MRFESGKLNAKLLGARIREARERLGLSQDELAELVSRDQAAISAYENGKRKVSAVDLPLFAQALEVSVLHFFEGEITPDDLDRAILHEFRQLPTVEAKRSAIDVLRTLSKVVNLHYLR